MENLNGKWKRSEDHEDNTTNYSTSSNGRVTQTPTILGN
jgi:hypothetical protein